MIAVLIFSHFLAFSRIFSGLFLPGHSIMEKTDVEDFLSIFYTIFSHFLAFSRGFFSTFEWSAKKVCLTKIVALQIPQIFP